MIKTFAANGDKWNQVVQSTAGSQATSVNASFSSWDPSTIKWSDVTYVPGDLNIVYPSTTVPGNTSMPYVNTPYFGDPNDIYPAYPYNGDPFSPGKNNMIGGCSGWNNQTFDVNMFNMVDPYAFTKPAGVRPDVLMGFFSKYVHALLFVTDTSSYVIPFMERVGAIWLQKGPNKWTAYDKKEFYDFIDNPEATIFAGTELNKREMQKTLADAKPEDDE